MKTVKTALTVLALTLALGLVSKAETWSIDKAHSSVGFTVSHMVISKVNGKFDDFDATVSFDGKDLKAASVEATVQIASVDTDNEKRDEHLRSGDFFDAENHPTMTFKSTKIEPGTDNEFKMTGDLTIRGVTKPVTFDAKLNGTTNDPWGNTRAGFSATAEINRQDFGVSWSSVLDNGGLVVSDNVTINLEIQVILDK